MKKANGQKSEKTGGRGFSLSRRAVLAAAALAAPAVLARRAMAAERCVIGTWGGDYARLLKQNIGDPILKPEGVHVIQAVADEAPRVAQLYAQRPLPHGTLDIACMGSPNGYRTATAGLLATLDAEQVPNLKNVLPVLHKGSFMPDEFVPHIWSPQVFVYNPKTVPHPPTSFAELLDPKWKGKVGVQSAAGFWVMLGVALAVGGSPDDFDQAKQYLLKLNANGIRLYPETDYIAPAFKSGEIDIAIIWMARAVMWQNAGFPVSAQFPKEGAIMYISGMTVPKNAPDKQAAYKYMNALLEPSAQVGFAEHMGYHPTVANAKLTGKIAEQLALPKDARLVQADYPKVTQLQPEMEDWWLKNIERK
ncbi:MAG: ABC transporter substrate-binding protein [Acetobacteraceae bacterium]